MKLENLKLENFWIVLRDKSETYVTKRYASFEEARAEAERLCKRESARFYVFYVLNVVGCAEPKEPPVQWWRLTS